MLRGWLKKPMEVKPYSRLAPIYDYVMRHVNYARWARYIDDLFKKSDIPVHFVLDIACGTGNMLIELFKLGYEVSGFDASFYMTEVAKEKIQKKDMRIPVWCESMTQFYLKQKVDACICTYDSINYCLDLKQCGLVLNCVAQVLNKGGLFVFDICTERNSRSHFQNYTEKDGTDRFTYTRKSYYIKEEKLQINEFIIIWHGDKEEEQVFKEKHLQRIYKINEIESIISPESFEVVGKYDGFTRRAGSEKSFRIHFLLRKI